MTAPSSFTRVGDLLGSPNLPDPDRPNDEGGATPWYYNGATREMQAEATGAYPLYVTFATCPKRAPLFGCGRQHRSLSIHPQYDDEALRYKLCDNCLEVHERQARERAARDRAEWVTNKRPSSRRAAAPVARLGGEL